MKTYVFKISFDELWNDDIKRNVIIKANSVIDALKQVKQQYVNKRNLMIDFIYTE